MLISVLDATKALIKPTLSQEERLSSHLALIKSLADKKVKRDWPNLFLDIYEGAAVVVDGGNTQVIH